MIEYKIASSLPGYLRLRLGRYGLGQEEAYSLAQALGKIEGIDRVECNSITGSVLIYHGGVEERILEDLSQMDLASLPPVAEFEKDRSVEISMKFKQDLGMSFFKRFVRKTFIPQPLSSLLIAYGASKYVFKGLKALFKGQVNVDVLDASAIGGSIAFGHFANAASIMFLLEVSDILEDYTREKSRNDLASALSFKVDQVWIQKEDGSSKKIPISNLAIGDRVIVRTGSMIPIDGSVVEGLAGVNQASMTGESFPVHKTVDDRVFAGTVVEEGELVIAVESLHSDSRIQAILNMVENSEMAKSEHAVKAEHLADRIVPYSFLFSGLVWLFTGDSHKTLSALTVDYSCAIKLATPIAVISAISQATDREIMVKGGRFLEAVHEADVIIFDKTGTLTEAKPEVKKILPMADMDETEVLRLSACLEEHYPHSLARAIVEKAEEENIKHKEEHAEVEYIVSHGIRSKWRGHEARIGSAHFLFEDNGIEITPDQEAIIEREGYGYSCVYLALDKDLVGVICIQDPPRLEAYDAIQRLRSMGLKKVIMMTGDGPAMAKKIAGELGIDQYYSEVRPEDKAQKVKELQEKGHRVIMVGDGVNDTPALASADVSVSLRDSSDLAREVADVTLLGEDLHALADLKFLSDRMMGRIEGNFQRIFTINTALLAFGALGIMQPTTTALLHNLSTAAIGLGAKRPYFPIERRDK